VDRRDIGEPSQLIRSIWARLRGPSVGLQFAHVPGGGVPAPPSDNLAVPFDRATNVFNLILDSGATFRSPSARSNGKCFQSSDRPDASGIPRILTATVYLRIHCGLPHSRLDPLQQAPAIRLTFLGSAGNRFKCDDHPRGHHGVAGHDAGYISPFTPPAVRAGVTFIPSATTRLGSELHREWEFPPPSPWRDGIGLR